MKISALVAFVLLGLISQAFAFGKAQAPSAPTVNTTPIDFSTGKISVQCGAEFVEKQTGDSAWHPVVDPSTGFTEVYGTAKYHEAILSGAGSSAEIAAGSDGFDESSEFFVTLQMETGQKPKLLFSRRHRDLACPNDLITESQFAFSGPLQLETLSNPIEFDYSAQVKDEKNECGESSAWTAGVGSSISYAITCTASAVQ